MTHASTCLCLSPMNVFSVPSHHAGVVCASTLLLFRNRKMQGEHTSDISRERLHSHHNTYTLHEWKEREAKQRESEEGPSCCMHVKVHIDRGVCGCLAWPGLLRPATCSLTASSGIHLCCVRCAMRGRALEAVEADYYCFAGRRDRFQCVGNRAAFSVLVRLSVCVSPTVHCARSGF
jgi:hypothetical protein